MQRFCLSNTTMLCAVFDTRIAGIWPESFSEATILSRGLRQRVACWGFSKVGSA
jgi:hypothetical protein